MCVGPRNEAPAYSIVDIQHEVTPELPAVITRWHKPIEYEWLELGNPDTRHTLLFTSIVVDS